MAESSAITIAYWPIRGLGAIPRLLAAYSGLNWTNKTYTQEEWADQKEKLGMPFPNLPYLTDGDFKLSESRAVSLYVIRQSGHNELLGSDIKQTANQGMVSGVIEDGFMSLVRVCFNPEFSKIKGDTYNAQKPRLTSLQNYLKKNGNEWFCGFLSVADFAFNEYWRYVTGMFPEAATDFPDLNSQFERLNALPKVKEYLASELHIAKPFLPPTRATGWSGV